MECHSSIGIVPIASATRGASPPSNVSSANVGALDRLSSKSSSSSLEKFLSTPMSEDGASAVAIQAALRNTELHPFSSRSYRDFSVTTPLSVSTAGSESSMNSAQSLQSYSSQLSVDSRGSRRGRRRWRRTQPVQDHMRGLSPVVSHHSRQRTSSPEPPSLLPSQQSAPHADWPTQFIAHVSDVPITKTGEIFCTWPSCSSQFLYRFDWNRHEEATHYCPYHWVCCHDGAISEDISHCLLCARTDHTTIEHCRSCASKDMESRVFLREDQLAQHIKRVHFSADAPKPKISKEVLSSWKVTNPVFPRAYLHCGFCGLLFDTWVQRQDHVFKHLSRGVCKSSWWPSRLAEPSLPTVR